MKQFLTKTKRYLRAIVERHSALPRQAACAALCRFERDLLEDERYADPRNLNRYERQVFSQSGEDGMIAEIMRRIGIESKTFLEIGVENGLETNTTFLLLQGWSGYWIEADQKQVESIRHHFKIPISENRLKIEQSFVTAENVARTLQDLQVPAEIDVFSLDIDRNTYHVWAALSHVKARVVVVEYNAAIPPEIDWKVDYHANRSWNGTSYFGASLKAYEKLGRDFGYCLVGCNLAGMNAFFVREDLCEDKFVAPFTSEKHYEPPRHFLMRRNGHLPCFTDDE